MNVLADGDEDAGHLVLDQGAEAEPEEAEQDRRGQQAGEHRTDLIEDLRGRAAQRGVPGQPDRGHGDQGEDDHEDRPQRNDDDLGRDDPGSDRHEDQRRRDGLVPVLGRDAQDAEDRRQNLHGAVACAEQHPALVQGLGEVQRVARIAVGRDGEDAEATQHGQGEGEGPGHPDAGHGTHLEELGPQGVHHSWSATSPKPSPVVNDRNTDSRSPPSWSQLVEDDLIGGQQRAHLFGPHAVHRHLFRGRDGGRRCRPA